MPIDLREVAGEFDERVLVTVETLDPEEKLQFLNHLILKSHEWNLLRQRIQHQLEFERDTAVIVAAEEAMEMWRRRDG